MSRPTALITGASRGIGRIMATALAEQGHDLLLAARDRSALEQTGTHCQALGATVRLIPGDLAEPDAADTLAAAALDAADGTIDVLINNAGFGLYGPPDAADAAAREAQYQVNLLAPVRLTHALLPGMRQRRRGRIGNVSSQMSRILAKNYGHYCATKGALRDWSETLDWGLRGTGVTCTTICPGPTATDFWKHESFTIAPPPGLASAEAVGRRAVRATLAGRHLVYCPGFWGPVVWAYALTRPLVQPLINAAF